MKLWIVVCAKGFIRDNEVEVNLLDYPPVIRRSSEEADQTRDLLMMEPYSGESIHSTREVEIFKVDIPCGH